MLLKKLTRGTISRVFRSAQPFSVTFSSYVLPTSKDARVTLRPEFDTWRMATVPTRKAKTPRRSFEYNGPLDNHATDLGNTVPLEGENDLSSGDGG